MSSQAFPKVVASRHAARTVQPINDIWEKKKCSSSPKSPISLAIGDPTADGNLTAPPALTNALLDVVQGGQYNGYPPTIGYDEVRSAVAKYWCKFVSPELHASIKGDNVIIASGVSHCIVLAAASLCNENDNLLIPCPGFPHYKTVCASYGLEGREYKCDPDKNWEVDLDHVRSLVDERTKGIVITNPSNPCGSNFSRHHVEQIVRLCEELRLPIISDEIYAENIFQGKVFTSVADFDTCLPRVIMGGTAKCMAIPGWRIGWSILVDRDNVASNWFDGMERIAQLYGGANSIVQRAHIEGLLNVPQDYLDKMNATLQEGAAAFHPLTEVGLSFNLPQASIFVLVKMDTARFADIRNDMEFFDKLLEEENVQVMPGSVFGIPGYFRVVTSLRKDTIKEAVERIKAFCLRHAA
ncbi:putative Aminotransferase class I and II [Trypanosoma vivax]|nr:Tyrosine aminotransferase [Trypanosoma vivax]KAH8611442.1 putative Aminotransferase class I and II [Trypanosoma vivax]